MKVIGEDGITYNINKEDFFLGDGGDDLITNVYKSTLYWYHLNNAMNELVDAGRVKQKKGERYDTKPIKTTLKLLKRELITRFGEKGLKEIEDDVDLSFMNNKPNKL